MVTNYRTEYFEKTDLTPIRGEPDFECLNRLKNELKRNAQSVPCELGGGNHGFLGLVLTPAEYATIVPTNPFVPQPHPGTLNIPAGTTGVQARVLESNYNNRMKLYEQCVAMEQALKQQLTKAIDDEWLEPLRNAVTDSIDQVIPTILTFLFAEHGDVSPASLSRREEDVKNMSYIPDREPIDKIFTEVQELAEFANAANAPYNEQQVINIAYVIIKKHRVFNQAITMFNREVRANAANNTWTFFKTFFCNAYRELREVGDLTVADTPFNEANLISGIVDALQQCQVIDTPSDHESQQEANSITRNTPTARTNDVMTNILTQMMQMQERYVDLSARLMENNNNRGGGRGAGRGRGRNQGGGRGNGAGRDGETRQGRRMFYCWSHGWCFHPGAYCRDRLEGHRPSATVDNRMNGSVEGLPPGYT